MQTLNLKTINSCNIYIKVEFEAKILTKNMTKTYFILIKGRPYRTLTRSCGTGVGFVLGVVLAFPMDTNFSVHMLAGEACGHTQNIKGTG